MASGECRFLSASGSGTHLIGRRRWRSLLGREDEVFLLKLVDGRFVRIASKPPNDYCVAVFKRRVHHDSVFRAGHPETGSVAFFYLGNRSVLSAVSVRD